MKNSNKIVVSLALPGFGINLNQRFLDYLKTNPINIYNEHNNHSRCPRKLKKQLKLRGEYVAKQYKLND